PDRYGRKPVALTSWALLLLLGIPAFLVMVHFRNGAALYAMTFLIGALIGLLTPAAVTLFTEALPARVRAGAIGTVYALAIAIFGGSAQFVAQLMANLTHSHI